ATGDLVRAIADYSEAIRLDPDKRPFRFWARGTALRETGQYDRALADYDIIQQLEPKNGWLLLERARTHAKMGQSQSARRDLDAALALSPADTELRTAVEREIAELPSAVVVNPVLPTEPAQTSMPTEAAPAQPTGGGQPIEA